jgi:UDP-N-acetylmuramoylalanine--D-glutamate ligase
MTSELVPWRRALVIGLGASGLAAARLLIELGVSVRGYDQREDVSDLPSALVPYTGASEPPAAAFEGVDLVVLSPGVAPLPLRALAATHAPDAEIMGELSLGLRLVHREIAPGAPPRIVLITGTNGKSTVTALTGHLLRVAGRDAFAGGNLGIPVCTLLLDALGGSSPWPDDLVIECSSFQLETHEPIPTAVAMVLNVTPDHLDRYASLQDYADTKARVFSGLGTHDLALVDAEDPWTARITPTAVCVAAIGDPSHAHIHEDTLVVHGDPPYPRSLLRLAGRHNGKNALFALSAARHLGVTPEQCLAGLASFEGLPHRMTLVRELAGVRYYDDSKATNVASALASLGGLDEPFVLIAGGKAKGDDLTPLGELLTRRAQGLVAIGEAAPAFVALGASAGVTTTTAASMQEAVHTACALARPGDAVVLAPACASFDQYRNYAHRGDAFANAVRDLPAPLKVTPS